MKNFTRLIALVAVLVGLALATGVAYAASLEQYLVDGMDGKAPVVTDPAEDDTIVVIGYITEITTDTLVVSDTVIAITPETVFVDEITVGDKVRVEAYYAEDGRLTALKVKLCDGDSDREVVKLTGFVTGITTDTLVLSDTVIAIVTDTVIIGTIDVGDLVNVHAYTAEDGSLTAFLIVQIKGCWDGETGSQGTCRHGDERTPPGAGNAYQGDNGQGDPEQGNPEPGNPDHGSDDPQEDVKDHGEQNKGR
jgi:acyl-CoA hydrolase